MVMKFCTDVLKNTEILCSIYPEKNKLYAKLAARFEKSGSMMPRWSFAFSISAVHEIYLQKR